MEHAEVEQRAEDDSFWGLDANEAAQAQEADAMQKEDKRSQAVHASIKREETFALWVEEDTKRQKQRTSIIDNLHEAARREYLQVLITWKRMSKREPKGNRGTYLQVPSRVRDL